MGSENGSRDVTQALQQPPVKRGFRAGWPAGYAGVHFAGLGSLRRRGGKLNLVATQLRAGLVEVPQDHRFCGYAAALVAGGVEHEIWK